MTTNKKVFSLKFLFKRDGDILFTTPQYCEMINTIRPNWIRGEVEQDVVIQVDNNLTSQILLAELFANLLELSKEEYYGLRQGNVYVEFKNKKQINIY